MQSEFLTLAKAAEVVSEATGNKYTDKAIRAWKNGESAHGTRLRCQLIGNRWYTTVDWLTEYFEASTRALESEEHKRQVAESKATYGAIKKYTAERLARHGIETDGN